LVTYVTAKSQLSKYNSACEFCKNINDIQEDGFIMTDKKMFCFQCQEALNGKGCTQVGVCGKTSEVANLQDLMIYALKGLSQVGVRQMMQV
jgi:hypothetical protein